LTKILDKANDVEPNYNDDSTCIQEAENETCAARWTSDIYWNVRMLIYKPKAQQLYEIICVYICMQQYK
jgi:hypothetical protein